MLTIYPIFEPFLTISQEYSQEYSRVKILFFSPLEERKKIKSNKIKIITYIFFDNKSKQHRFLYVIVFHNIQDFFDFFPVYKATRFFF